MDLRAPLDCVEAQGLLSGRMQVDDGGGRPSVASSVVLFIVYLATKPGRLMPAPTSSAIGLPAAASAFQAGRRLKDQRPPLPTALVGACTSIGASPYRAGRWPTSGRCRLSGKVTPWSCCHMTTGPSPLPSPPLQLLTRGGVVAGQRTGRAKARLILSGKPSSLWPRGEGRGPSRPALPRRGAGPSCRPDAGRRQRDRRHPPEAGAP